MKKEKVQSQLSRALLEIADDLRSTGIMDQETHCKITLRHPGGEAAVVDDTIGGEEMS